MVGPPEVIGAEFHNFGRCAIEIAIADPRRSGAHVDQAAPTLPLTTVRKPDEVELLQAFQLDPGGLIRDTFVLHGALVPIDQATDDECDLGIPSQVVHLSRYIQRVKEDLEIIGHDNAYDGRLRSDGWRSLRKKVASQPH